MSGASDSFSVQFWTHLERPLRNLCTAHARCVAANVTSFAEAYDAVWHDAVRHGATHLPPAVLRNLEDWVAHHLLDEITRAEADGWGQWPRPIPAGWNPWPTNKEKRHG